MVVPRWSVLTMIAFRRRPSNRAYIENNGVNVWISLWYSLPLHGLKKTYKNKSFAKMYLPLNKLSHVFIRWWKSRVAK